jgi:uncharacterized protein
MLHNVVGWFRERENRRARQGHVARWLGRNWARVTYGYHVEPTWLEVNRLDVPIDSLPAAFRGYRIAQLSDLHCGRHVTPAYLDEAIDLALAADPHLIVLTGDFIHKGFRYVDRVAATVARLRAPDGVYAVLGNHDFSVRNALGVRRHRHLHSAVAGALSAQGIRVLHNESVHLTRAEERLHLVGVADLWSRVCDLDRAFAGLDTAVPTVVLAHNPRTVERLAGRRCDLMLSGHTHGGQVNWPGLGRPTLGPRARRFAAGMYQHGTSQLYVNKGVGFGVRFRFGVRPEVAVLSLQPS